MKVPPLQLRFSFNIWLQGRGMSFLKKVFTGGVILGGRMLATDSHQEKDDDEGMHACLAGACPGETMT